ncbi:hypothetical protein [Candidatus Poriferisodalis sp.]|uniref:hypothetical protein n=1 Tax=Candidatus Poriferisodalis sp. TaxID=3101277 RepID=UPI003B029446
MSYRTDPHVRHADSIMTALTGFRIVVWLGVGVNAAFWAPALVAPQVINDIFGFEPDYYTVWLRNVGMVLLLVSITNAAAAVDPRRYQLFAWLVVVGRYIAALFFLEIWALDLLDSSDKPSAFMWFFITDASLGTISGILLYIGLRQRRQASNGRHLSAA